MQIKGSTELHDEVQKKGLCVNCGGCTELCPYFKSYRGKIARMSACTIAEGRCHANCPKVEVELEKLAVATQGKPFDGAPLGHYLEVRQARAGSQIREKGSFQNGGVVSALLCYALKAGTIDAAALTRRDGLVPVPVLAKTEAEVLASSGAKYMAAPVLSTANDYLRRGEKKLAVVGTPCQITSVAQMKLNPLEREDFNDGIALTIGLFCTWAVETRAFIDLVSSVADPAAVVSMDVPPPPAAVMKIRTGAESLTIPLEQIRKTVPAGCAICPDMTAEFADLSVGALEGDYQWNTVVVRTAKGKELVDRAVQAGYLETVAMPAAPLENLVQGATGKKRRGVAKAKEEGLLNCGPSAGCSALIIDQSVVEKILADR